MKDIGSGVASLLESREHMESMKLNRLVSRILRGHLFEDPEGVFVRMEDWAGNPTDADLFVFTFQESEEFDELSGVPVVAAELGLRYLLIITDLAAVITNRSTQAPLPVLMDYVAAIDYYREHDSFWPG